MAETIDRLKYGSVLTDLIIQKLEGIVHLDLGYLRLMQASPTLSGGEMQRIRLSQMLDSELSGIIYILDEPTAGLHEDDTNRVIDAMRALRERDNTVIVIEHDTQVIRAADYIVEIGPGAGREGGEVVYQGRRRIFHRLPDLSYGAIWRRRFTCPRVRRAASPIC